MQRLQNIKAEGDDLIAAQVFITSVKAQMETLSGVNRFDHIRARRAVLKVRDGAQYIFAKAIVRVCNQTLELFDQESSQPKIDSLLMTLQKLVSQYAHGLDEVLNGKEEGTLQKPTLQKTPNTDSPSGTSDVVYLEPAETSSSTHIAKLSSSSLPANDLPIGDRPMGDEPMRKGPTGDGLANAEPDLNVARVVSEDDLSTLSDAHSKAGQVLVPLLKFVKDARKKTALDRLVLHSAPRGGVTQNKTLSFENILPSVTNSILTDARQLGKNVSVSYLDNDMQIPDAHVEPLKTSLKELGRYLVRECLETPTVRSLRGQSSVGQISITAQSNAQSLEITLTCQGTEIAPSLEGKIKSLPQGYKARILACENKNDDTVGNGASLMLCVPHALLNSEAPSAQNLSAPFARFPLTRDSFTASEGRS